MKSDGVQEIRKAVLTVLENPEYARSAGNCSRDFRAAPGPEGAAEFIESAPHLLPEEDKRLVRGEILSGVWQLLYWAAAVPLILLLPRLWGSWWIYAILANLLYGPFRKMVTA